MKSWMGKTVLITGASAGIGSALAREYGKRGAHLILTARRRDRLDALAEELQMYNRKVLTYTADVCVDGELEKAVLAALKEVPALDVVIANAGFGVAGPVQKLTLEDYRRQFETNVYGVLRTLYASLDALTKSRGQFVVLGSVAGHVSLPGNSPYGMSKHAVRSLADSLWYELRPLGIRVSHVSPGFIATEIRKVNNRGELLPNAKDPIPEWLRATPEAAARSIAKGVDRAQREIVVTLHGRVILGLFRWFPELCHWLVRRFGVSSRREPT